MRAVDEALGRSEVARGLERDGFRLTPVDFDASGVWPQEHSSSAGYSLSLSQIQEDNNKVRRAARLCRLGLSHRHVAVVSSKQLYFNS